MLLAQEVLGQSGHFYEGRLSHYRLQIIVLYLFLNIDEMLISNNNNNILKSNI